MLDVRSMDSPLRSICEENPHTNAVNSIAINEKGDVACASDDMSVSVFSLASSKLAYRSTSHTDFVRGVAWSPENASQFKTVGWDSQAFTHTVQ